MASMDIKLIPRHASYVLYDASLEYLETGLGKPSLKKTIFLLTFVNKDFTPPPNYWRKTIEVRGSGQGGDPPPFIKVKNNIV